MTSGSIVTRLPCMCVSGWSGILSLEEGIGEAWLALGVPGSKYRYFGDTWNVLGINESERIPAVGS